MKRILDLLPQERKEYYLYLVRECLSSLARAEDYYSMHMYPSSDRMLFYSAELFWKALIVLSNQVFDWGHEPETSQEFGKISEDILPSTERARLYKIVAELPEMRRNLAIYGYVERGRRVDVAPSRIISAHDVDQDFARVRSLVETLRRVHFFQMSSPPIRVGVLSGYVNSPTTETRCESHPYSGFGTTFRWMHDLAASFLDPDEMFHPAKGGLFIPEEIEVAKMGSEFYPLVINPFGECFPEKGEGRGVALDTILAYVRDGGIFVNAGGHPFIYTWNVDVTASNQRPLVSYIRVPTEFKISKNERGELEMIVGEGARFPGDALILTTEFKAVCAWDRPGVVGPQEVDVTHAEKLGRDLKDRANVFRPIVTDGPVHVVPLVVTGSQLWGPVCPIAAIPYGRGFLISCGMNLDAEKEYKILLGVIERLARMGFDTLLSS